MNSLIQTDKDYFRMEAQIENHGQNQDLAVILSQQKKHLFLYKNPVNRYSDFVGVLNDQAFSYLYENFIAFSKNSSLSQQIVETRENR